jgi:hypothetical protein
MQISEKFNFLDIQAFFSASQNGAHLASCCSSWPVAFPSCVVGSESKRKKVFDN